VSEEAGGGKKRGEGGINFLGRGLVLTKRPQRQKEISIFLRGELGKLNSRTCFEEMLRSC
jgi:hypothetical protein